MKHIYSTFFALSCLVSALNAQSELTVNCYPENTPFNSVSLNNDVVEYGICSEEPAFYVAVFDPATCAAWKSEFNGLNPEHNFGNFNVNGACRQREESYFIFQYSDVDQLTGMDNLINQIPAGFPYVIYTPISYDYLLVSNNSPALIQTLSSLWDSDVILSDHIMVLFGIQGQPATFTEDTLTNGDHISFTTTICDVTGLTEINAQLPTVSYAGDGHFYISADKPVSDVHLMSLTGERIPAGMLTGTTLLSTNPLAKGIYFVHGTMNGREWSQKVVVY